MNWLSERDLAGAVLDAPTSSVCVLDGAGFIVSVNKAWREFAESNGSTDSFLGANYLAACMGSSSGRRIAGLFEEVLSGRRERVELEYPCHGPGEKRWYLCRVTPLRSAGSDAVQGAVVSHQNITARKVLERKLKTLAVTDELTGLSNRRHFLDAAVRAMEKLKRHGTPCALVLIDLDRFKLVNDTYGHEAGDQALCFAASQMKAALRAGDMLARIGGEELGVLSNNNDEWGAIMQAERMRKTLSARPLQVGGASITISASFGVAAMLPTDTHVSEVMGRADQALYRAKADGRNRVCAQIDPLQTCGTQGHEAVRHD